VTTEEAMAGFPKLQNGILWALVLLDDVPKEYWKDYIWAYRKFYREDTTSEWRLYVGGFPDRPGEGSGFPWAKEASKWLVIIPASYVKPPINDFGEVSP
jgi:hypothetical protein